MCRDASDATDKKCSASSQRRRGAGTVLDAEDHRRASSERQKKKSTKPDLDLTQPPLQRSGGRDRGTGAALQRAASGEHGELLAGSTESCKQEGGLVLKFKSLLHPPEPPRQHNILVGHTH